MDLKRFTRPGQPQQDHLTPLIATEFGRRLVHGGRRPDLFYRTSGPRFAAFPDNPDVPHTAAFPETTTTTRPSPRKSE